MKEALLEKETKEEKKLSLEEIKSKISEVEDAVKTVSYDLETLSKIVDKFAGEGDNSNIDNHNMFNFDGLMFLHRTLKEKSSLLYNEGEKLELMQRYDFPDSIE